MIQIDHNVPIPDRRIGGGKTSTYPFSEMKIGDSFALPEDDAGRLGAAAKQWKRRHADWDYRTKKSVGFVRIWRI